MKKRTSNPGMPSHEVPGPGLLPPYRYVGTPDIVASSEYRGSIHSRYHVPLPNQHDTVRPIPPNLVWYGVPSI